MAKKIGAAFLLLALILIGAGVWYYGYHAKTPQYSLGLIQKSVENRDTVTFRQHVDLDSILSRSVDDIIAFAGKDPTAPALESELGQSIFVALKPAIVNGLKIGILEAVEQGKNPVAPGQRGTLTADPGEIARRAGLRDITFREVTATREQGDEALAGVKISEPDIGDYVLNLRMKRLEDKTWKITEIMNLKEYLIDLDKARKEAQRQYLENTRPILEKYDAEFNAIATASPIASVENITRRIENRRALAAELQKVAIPPAAREIASLREELLNATVDYLTGIRQNFSGDNSLETMQRARESRTRATALENDLQRLEESIQPKS
ncbi:MAG: hypothetical protein IJS96_04890 [Schwartzia sp.]|nr:hypothetical protein [Schwartzia sp. (in: firmicutes)]